MAGNGKLQNKLDKLEPSSPFPVKLQFQFKCQYKLVRFAALPIQEAGRYDDSLGSLGDV